MWEFHQYRADPSVAGCGLAMIQGLCAGRLLKEPDSTDLPCAILDTSLFC